MKSLRQCLYLFNLLLLVCLLLAILCIGLLHKFLQAESDGRAALVADTSGFVMAQKMQVPISQIYGKRDIFGQGLASAVVEQSKNIVASSIPQLVIPEIPKQPSLPPMDFIAPLSLTLRGVIWSTKQDKSMCIVSDETDKELTLKVGDKIRDGSVIKILRDRMVVLRLNGQLETFFINDASLAVPIDPVLSIQSLGDGRYGIDIDKFKSSVSNIGSFLDYFDAVPLVGESGKMVGIVVLEADTKKLPAALGFQLHDVILRIADIDVFSNKNRIKIYDELVFHKKVGDEFSVEFLRNGVKNINHYVLQSVSKQKTSKSSALIDNTHQLVTKPQDSISGKSLTDLMMNNRKSNKVEQLDEAELKRTESKYQENITRIRQEMIDRMQQRSN